MKWRGHDPEYMVAQLIHALISEVEAHNKVFYAENPELAPKDPHPDYCGFGVDREYHGDIEYLYCIDERGTVTVKGVRYRGSSQSFKTLGKFKVGTTYDEAMTKLGDVAA